MAGNQPEIHYRTIHCSCLAGTEAPSGNSHPREAVHRRSAHGEGMSVPKMSPVALEASLENSQVDPRSHPAAEQTILFSACALLAFGVLALGAVQEWPLCVLECGAALLFGLWAGYQMILQRIRLTSNALIPALLLLSLPILQLSTG